MEKKYFKSLKGWYLTMMTHSDKSGLDTGKKVTNIYCPSFKYILKNP